MRSTTQAFLMFTFVVSVWVAPGQSMAFDPNQALEQHRQEQQRQQESQEVQAQRELYERYRNRAPAQINEDGTVTIGNLQWMRCSLGQRWNGESCVGEPSEHNWDDANLLPGLMNTQGGFAGYTDWRLPTIAELASLRVCSSGRAERTANLPGDVRTFFRCASEFSSPTLDTRLFPNASTWFVWSRSPHASYSAHAWVVSFNFGLAGSSSLILGGQVRLVRDGQ